MATIAKRAGIGHVHPHQLRHTLATQSINRGMSLEAIAALLGHRSMDMTLTYARISDDTVADAYFKVTEAVEAQYYGHSGPTLAITSSSTKAPASDHRRLLANGHCTRPALLDCAFESVCERCGFFETGPAVPHHLEAATKARRRAWSERAQSAFRRPHRGSRRRPVSVLPWNRPRSLRITCITPGRGVSLRDFRATTPNRFQWFAVVNRRRFRMGANELDHRFGER